MKKEDVKKVVKYWQKTAEHDYETMLYLFKGFSHFVISKRNRSEVRNL